MKLKLPDNMHWLYRYIKITGFAVLLCLIFTFSANIVFSQVTLQIVDFESEGSGYTVQPQEYTTATGGGTPDYWTRTNGGIEISPATAFSNIQGTWFFAGEDVDYDTYTTKYYVTCSSVSISGYTDLQVKLLLGGRTGTTIEVGDFIKIQYQIDGGEYVTLAQFLGDGTLADAYLEDADADGTVDSPNVPLSAALNNFTYSIPVTGSTLAIRIHVYNGTGEEVAFDNIQVIGSVAADAPTVTTAAASSITAVSATLGGNVTSDGGASVIERGVVYSTTDVTPTIAEGATQDANGSGTGSFSETIGSLNSNTTYYYNSYAINSEGTSYGVADEFTTLSSTAIENASFGDINVYPNPVNNLLYIETGGISKSDHALISITDLTGKTVFSKNYEGTLIKVDVSSFKPGIYFITIKTPAYTKSMKTIIE